MPHKNPEPESQDDFNQELFEFYQHAYEFEVDRKDRVVDRLNLALTQLAVAGGALGYFVTLFPEMPSFHWPDLVFYLPFGGACAAFLGALALVSQAAARGFKYSYLPKPNEIARFIKQTTGGAEEVPPEAQGSVRHLFRQHLGRQYCDFASVNFDNNEKRNVKITRAFKFLVLTLVCLILALPGFVGVKSHAETGTAPNPIIKK